MRKKNVCPTYQTKWTVSVRLVIIFLCVLFFGWQRECFRFASLFSCRPACVCAIFLCQPGNGGANAADRCTNTFPKINNILLTHPESQPNAIFLEHTDWEDAFDKKKVIQNKENTQFIGSHFSDGRVVLYGFFCADGTADVKVIEHTNG